MIALLPMQAAATAPDPALDAIPRQELPASGCAAYLWTLGEGRRLVAMAGAEPARLRLSLGGRIVDLPRASGEGAGGLGFAGVTRYRLGEVSATLDMTVETPASLTRGGVVPRATLDVEQAGKDGLVTPVAGLIGCAA